MIIHPQPDPVAFHLGPVSVHWYGLMYLLAFFLFVVLGRIRIKQPHIAAKGWKNEDLDDMLFYGVLGVVIGGRLGEVFFYNFHNFLNGYYFSHPLEIIAIWKGGMSYHGGFLGVLVAMWLWARKAGRSWIDVLDFIAPLVPTGYLAGRIGNFINAELPGRIAPDGLPWAMLWPDMSAAPWPTTVYLQGLRHPSPIYQALVDGLLVFIILWLYARKARPALAVGALYTMLYGCARFFTEYFRTPDYEVSALGMTISAGQMFSLPMVFAGLAMLVWAYRRQTSLPVQS